MEKETRAGFGASDGAPEGRPPSSGGPGAQNRFRRWDRGGGDFANNLRADHPRYGGAGGYRGRAATRESMVAGRSKGGRSRRRATGAAGIVARRSHAELLTGRGSGNLPKKALPRHKGRAGPGRVILGVASQGDAGRGPGATSEFASSARGGSPWLPGFAGPIGGTRAPQEKKNRGRDVREKAARRRGTTDILKQAPRSGGGPPRTDGFTTSCGVREAIVGHGPHAKVGDWVVP